jgi:cyanophycinase
VAGPLALVGGEEWREGCEFDAELLGASGGNEVVVLPTGAAYEHPDKAIAAATAWFGRFGATVRGLHVLTRPDALDEANAKAVGDARFVYLAGGSPLHLRSVLKETPVWEALVNAWEDGAVVAGSSAGAMALCEPMVDPRGGALTVGLGLLVNLAVVPHAEPDLEDHHRRTLELLDPGVALAAIPPRTALIRAADGAWRSAGAGKARIFLDGAETGLEALPS